MTSYVHKYSALQPPSPELLSQTVESFVKEGDKISKITVRRIFHGVDDYTDSTTTQVIWMKFPF